MTLNTRRAKYLQETHFVQVENTHKTIQLITDFIQREDCFKVLRGKM